MFVYSELNPVLAPPTYVPFPTPKSHSPLPTLMFPPADAERNTLTSNISIHFKVVEPKSQHAGYIRIYIYIYSIYIYIDRWIDII